MNPMRAWAGLFLCMALAIGMPSLTGELLAQQAAQPAPSQGIFFYTKPSDEVKLSFVRPGTVSQVCVKEGQAVKAGDMLAKQDDSAELVQLEELKAVAEDTIKREASQAQLDLKKLQLAKLSDALKKGASTELEVEQARVDVRIAELQLKLEKFQNAQDAMKYRETQLLVERMRLRSPFDGRVVEVLLKQGEAATDATSKVIRVVRINPLWVDVPVPLEQTYSLQAAAARGQDVQVDVVFPAMASEPGAKGSSQGTVVKGKVVYISPVANSASNTREVRVEVPNPNDRPAAEPVEVRFPGQSPSNTKLSSARSN
jgi:RND family efflux transporter MFP subunit